MTSKVTVQKNIFAESLAIVGRAVGSHTHLPILSQYLAYAKMRGNCASRRPT